MDKAKRYWTAHEKGTGRALITIDASDDEAFNSASRKFGPVNWDHATDEEVRTLVTAFNSETK